MPWATAVEVQDDYFSEDEVSTSGDDASHQDLEEPEETEQVEYPGSDIDADISRAHGPKTTSEKRRAQNEVMRAFADDITAHVTQKEVEEAAAKGANEEQLSIRDILASQDTTARITNPRDYQTELFQRAKMQNTIAVLDTGTGKTHIATLLLRHILEEELEHRAKGSIHKIAFFLVKQPLFSYQTHADTNRSTRSAWCSNKPMFYAAVLIRTSKVSVAIWASHFTRKAPGVNFSPTTWS